MSRNGRAIPIIFAFLLAASCGLIAQQREAVGIDHSVLDNGMEIFVMENHAVPLARIQITFRCGSITQSPETAGLFHLYEHMLFKGNSVYRTQSDFQAAMRELGVADWNGGTSAESVTYYFTIPSDRVEKGIRFWANTVRSPLLDAEELSTEKDVVAAEILGYLSDPDSIYRSGVDSVFYWKYPWRRDVSGYEKSVRAADAAAMRSIRDTWYVPNNAALFVGGDVDPKAVRSWAKRAFGDWPRRKNPWAPPLPPHPDLRGDALLVYADEQMYSGMATASLLFRGPDVTRSPEPTYAADVWVKLLDDPNGRFKSSIFEKVPGLYKKEYIWAEYPTQRDGAFVGFSTYLRVLPGQDTFARAIGLRQALAGEMASLAGDSGYFSPHDFQVLKRQLADRRIFERETTDGFVSGLSFWWAVAGFPYYTGYDAKLARVGQADIARFLSDYVLSHPSVLSLRMNPQDFARERAAAEKAGWKVITKDNAYWWAKADAGGAGR